MAIKTLSNDARIYRRPTPADDSTTTLLVEQRTYVNESRVVLTDGKCIEASFEASSGQQTVDYSSSDPVHGSNGFFLDDGFALIGDPFHQQATSELWPIDPSLQVNNVEGRNCSDPNTQLEGGTYAKQVAEPATSGIQPHVQPRSSLYLQPKEQVPWCDREPEVGEYAVGLAPGMCGMLFYPSLLRLNGNGVDQLSFANINQCTALRIEKNFQFDLLLSNVPAHMKFVLVSPHLLRSTKSWEPPMKTSDPHCYQLKLAVVSESAFRRDGLTQKRCFFNAACQPFDELVSQRLASTPSNSPQPSNASSETIPASQNGGSTPEDEVLEPGLDGQPLRAGEGDFLPVCDHCVQREVSRSARRKFESEFEADEQMLWMRTMYIRPVILSCDARLEMMPIFPDEPETDQLPIELRQARWVRLTGRVACYPRHHVPSEKWARLIFTLTSPDGTIAGQFAVALKVDDSRKPSPAPA